jgi:multiple sugar transport system substrate-binding protein
MGITAIPHTIDRRTFLKTAALSGTGLALAGCSQADLSASTKINYWHHFTNQTEMRGLQEVTAMFAAQYPNIQMVQENIPNKDFMAKFTATVQAGTPPDTTMVTSERLGNMVAMRSLVDLTERVNNWELKKHFPADRWTGVSVNGKIYGVPAFTFVDWMYYRKDWFEEAGIDSPPTTMEEFLETAIKLTDPSKGRYGFGMRAGDGGQFMIVDMIEAFGSPILVDGKPAIDAAKATEALRFFSELYTKHKVVPPSAPNDSYRQIMEAFRTGQTGMLWHGTGSLTEVQRSLNQDQFMTALRPAGPAALISRLSYLYNGLMKEDHAEAAWAWVNYWGHTDPAIKFMEVTGYFPASALVATDPRVTSDPYFAVAIQAVENGRLPHQFVGADAWGRHTVLPAFQEILTGASTPEQAVEQIIKGLEKILR